LLNPFGIISTEKELSKTKEKSNGISYTRRKSVMARPHKIRENTKTYNLLMAQRQYDILSAHSQNMSAAGLEQIAVADLIREAIDIYIEAIEDEEYEGEVTGKDTSVQKLQGGATTASC
jgi:predicted DNA-binding protein